MPYKLNPLTGEMDYYEETYKVGMVYINLTGADPATELGYGIWEFVGTLDVTPPSLP
jgi:hypothetical protein